MEMYLEELPRSFYGKSFVDVALYVYLSMMNFSIVKIYDFKEFVLNFELCY